MEAKYDWEKIKQEFFQSDIPQAFTFMQWKFGRESVENSGHIQNSIVGWTEEKRKWQRGMTNKAKETAERELTEKLKISFQDLLLSKKLLFSLDSRYLEILGKMAQPNPQNPLSENDFNFYKNYPDRLRDIWMRIQIELGLPINVQALGLENDNIGKLTIEVVKNGNDSGGG